MNHIILLGDSVFDNAAYVKGSPDVVTHLRRLMPAGWKATLRAIDGSVVQGVRHQLLDLPSDATHLIISAGGNDALHRADILEQKVHSAAEVLSRLADIADEFHSHYREMLRAVMSMKLPAAICTIYYPRFPEPVLQRLAVTALSVFNDIIIREAVKAGIPLLDLRLICNEDADYANPIEPSAVGGGKVAAVIMKVVYEHEFERGRTEVFT